jgi:hypothetical protein
MPTVEPALTREFRGRMLDLAAVATRAGWALLDGPEKCPSQSLPFAPRLWAHAIPTTWERPGDAVVLYLFVHADRTGRVKRVETGVYRPHPPRALEELPRTFHDPDLRSAREVLAGALTVEAAAERAREQARRRGAPLSLEELAGIIGARADDQRVVELVRRFDLARTPVPLGAGSDYAGTSPRLSLRTGPDGRVAVVIFRPAPQDELLGPRHQPACRVHVRARYGLPTSAGAEPVVFDQYDDARQLLRFEYGGPELEVGAVTITARSAAT